MARDYMGEVKGYPYIDCAIITEKIFEYRDKTGPFMTTSWNQTYPFNSHLDLWYEPLGCVTIATGQIMKYHRWPAKYNWTLMPDGTSNDTLSAFLKELHDELGVENGYASITDAARVFNSYAYNCRRIVHSVSEVDKSIAMQLPVYMRGEDAKKQEGHAWVCDGKLTIQPRVEYKLYLLTFNMGKPQSLDEFASEMLFGQLFHYYHMNWGWGGEDDAFYLDGLMNVQDQKYHFSSNRQDLIISK